MADQFPPSTLVTVVGTSNEAINGQRGIILRFDIKKQRFVVELDNVIRRQVALKAINLKRCDDEDDDDDLDDLPDLVDQDGNVQSTGSGRGDIYLDDDLDDLPDLVPPPDQHPYSFDTPHALADKKESYDDLPDLVDPDGNTHHDDDDLPDLVDPDEPYMSQQASNRAPTNEQHESPAASFMKSNKRCCVCTMDVQRPIVLRACSHIFCQTCPRQAPNMSCCISCQKCDPIVEALQSLPYVIDMLDPSDAVLQLLFDEYLCHRNLEVIEAIEEKHKKQMLKHEKDVTKKTRQAKDIIRKVKEQVKDTRTSQTYKDAKAKLDEIEAEMERKRILLWKKQQASWETRGIQSSVSALEKDKEELAQDVTKAIEKHYRRTSIKVHPDRFGDEFLEEFDGLTKARNVLRQPELRTKYIEQMLEVWCKVGPSYIASSHESWVGTHQPDVADQKKQSAGVKKQVFALQGGILHDKPRKLGVEIKSDGQRNVRIHFRLPRERHQLNSFQFFQYCKSIHVFGEQVNGDSGEEIYLASIDGTVLEEIAAKNEYGDFHYDVDIPHNGLWDISWQFTVDFDGEIISTPRSEEARVDLMSLKQYQNLETLANFEEMARKRTLEIRSVLSKVSRGGQEGMTAKYEALQSAVLKGRHTLYLLRKFRGLCGETALQSNSTQKMVDLEKALDDTESHQEAIEKFLAINEKRKALKQFKAKVYDLLESGHSASWLATVSADQLVAIKGDANRLYQLLIEGKQAHSIELVDVATLDAAIGRDDIFSSKQIEAFQKRCSEVEERATKLAAANMKEANEKAAAERDRVQLEKRACLMERGSVVVLQGLKSQPELNGSLATYMGLGQGDRYVVRLYKDHREVALTKDKFRKWDGGLTGLNFESNAVSQSWQCLACTYLHEGSLAMVNKCCICETDRDSMGVDDGKAKPYIPPVTDVRTLPCHDKGEAINGINKKKATTTKIQKTLKKEKKAKRCQFGIKCRWLKQNTCKFYHTAEEVASVTQSTISTPVDVTSNVTPAAPIQPSRPVDKVVAPPTKKNTKIALTTFSVSSRGVDSVSAPLKQHLTSTPVTASSNHGSERDHLLEFLQTQKGSLKCSPNKFFEWLVCEDITSISDLCDALIDEDCQTQLVYNGLKKFKVPFFEKAAKRVTDKANSKSTSTRQIPDELMCSITHSIFEDPVVAQDGCTYERHAIEAWFQKQENEIEDAHAELLIMPSSDRATAILARGVMAPSGVRLDDLSLVPNNNTRIMANAFRGISL